MENLNVGTKIQMNNGVDNVQEGVVFENDGMNGTVVRWDTPNQFDETQVSGISQEHVTILPNDWIFKFINIHGGLQ